MKGQVGDRILYRRRFYDLVNVVWKFQKQRKETAHGNFKMENCAAYSHSYLQFRWHCLLFSFSLFWTLDVDQEHNRAFRKIYILFKNGVQTVRAGTICCRQAKMQLFGDLKTLIKLDIKTTCSPFWPSISFLHSIFVWIFEVCTSNAQYCNDIVEWTCSIYRTTPSRAENKVVLRIKILEIAGKQSKPISPLCFPSPVYWSLSAFARSSGPDCSIFSPTFLELQAAHISDLWPFSVSPLQVFYTLKHIRGTASKKACWSQHR